MVDSNWIEEAAQEIRIGHLKVVGEILETDEIVEIIKAYCPFKSDTAYEEIGGTSRKLDQIIETLKFIRSNL
jgi:hypothetical protein